MKYIYYQGCSLEGTAREYDISTRALMQAAGAELVELPDWTCCGASAAEPTSFLLSLALPARNLAKAEQMGDIRDILVPCSACYLNLKRVEEKIRTEPEILDKLNTILAEEHLELTGRMRVRHILDVIINDVGAESIRSLVKKKLNHLVVAPYYGCQCLRPYPVFDDPERPQSMEPILDAVGAGIHVWDMGGRCCGASHMNTKMEVGIALVSAILKNARGADAVVTVCPMCQMNLESFQNKASRVCKEDVTISVVYLPQLIGLALDLSETDLGLNLNLSITEKFRNKLKS